MRSFVLAAAMVALALGADLTTTASPPVDYQTRFDYMDANGDDHVDMKEYKALYEAADTDKSGNLSAVEYITHSNNSGYNPDQILLIFFLIDSNGDLNISESEIEATFQYEDTDKDGKMSFTEFKTGQLGAKGLIDEASKSGIKITAMIDAADVDNDDNLSGDEMWSIVSPADKDGNGFDKSEFEKYWMEKTGYSKGLSGYLFSVFDADKDGVFGSEFDKNSVYIGFDHDKNGTVSTTEFKNAMIFLYARATRGFVATTMVKPATFSIENLFKEADGNSDGYLSKSEVVYAEEVSAEDIIKFYMKHGMSFEAALYFFFGLDENSDNKYTSDEMKGTFERFDVNDDSKVSLMELAANLNVAFSELAVAEKTGERLEVMFDHGDGDGNDELTREEFAGVFKSADTNGDKLVNQAEFKSFWMRNTKEPEDRTDILFTLLDADGDDKIRQAEEDAQFDRFDYDDNDTVSEREFMNSMLYLFSKVMGSLRAAKDAKVVIG